MMIRFPTRFFLDLAVIIPAYVEWLYGNCISRSYRNRPITSLHIIKVGFITTLKFNWWFNVISTFLKCLFKFSIFIL